MLAEAASRETSLDVYAFDVVFKIIDFQSFFGKKRFLCVCSPATNGFGGAVQTDKQLCGPPKDLA